jgi:VCBS repeat-containing protein
MENIMSSELLLNVHLNYTGGAEYTVFIFGEPNESVSLQNNNGYSASATLNAEGFASVVIPNTEDMEGTGINNQGITITSEGEIAAYLSSRENYTTDLTIIFDKESLGNKYLIASYQGSYGEGGQFSAQATEDNTTLTITFPNGEVLNKVINKGETYKFATDNVEPSLSFGFGYDLTGTIIESSAPVAVFSGSGCVNVGDGACDHIVEQMPAVENLSTSYVVGESYSPQGLGNNLVRVVAAEDGTDVTIDGAVVATLDAGTFYEFTLSDNAEVINTSKPTLVAQYLQGLYTAGEGDPAMMFVPGQDAWLSSYKLATPVGDDAFSTNLVNVIISADALPSLLVNGVAPDATLFTPVAGSDLVVGNVPIAAGIVTLTASETFQTSIFGFDSADSYLTFGAASFAAGVSNAAPVAVNDSFGVEEGVTLITTSILANDTDANDDDVLTITEINGAAAEFGVDIALASGATFSVSADGQIIYNQNDAFEYLNNGDTAQDTISYTITDGEAISTATVTITVDGVTGYIPDPDPYDPVATNDVFAVDEDVVLVTPSILANDVDGDGDGILTIAAIDGSSVVFGADYTLASGATINVTEGGVVTYNQNGAFDALNDGETAVDSVSYTLLDGSGLSGTGFISFTIEGVTDGDTTNPFDGTDANDTIKGDNGTQTINGFGGQDQLYGRGGSDTINGGTGDDTVAGQAGGDTLTGGTGKDVFAYSTITDSTERRGVDKITDFTQGDDKIDLATLGVASLAELTISTEAGETFVSFGDLKICLSGEFALTSDDFVFAGTPVNPFDGTEGNDTIKGDGDANTINGFGGNDLLLGRLGNDSINGGDGNDILAGQASADALNGGAGADTFLFTLVKDSSLLTGVDTISDFTQGEDKIDVAALGAKELADLVISTVAGNTSVAFGSFVVSVLGEVPFTADDFVFADCGCGM